MKKPITILFSAFLISIAGMQQSCTKEDQQEMATNIATSYINNGKWKVTRFEEDGKNETDHFSGYVFSFNTDGSVTATKGSNTVKGTWSTGSDDSKSKFVINFPSAPFSELNEDWIIKSGSAGSIQLQHTSGGDGTIDYLNFEKI